MRYDISKPTAPMMPNLGKGTECIKLLLSQASGAEFQYPDNKWLEMCGLMANLVADSGCNKGQLSHLVEAICHDFTEHDEAELKKLVTGLVTIRYKPCAHPLLGLYAAV